MSDFDFENHYPLVRVSVIKEDVSFPVWTIVDTGSPYTIIPNSILNKLGLGFEDAVTMITIHGVVHKEECVVEAPAYLLEMQIGEKSLKKMLVVGYDFDPRFGLLGHNALVNFQLFIDWHEKMIELRG
ncbi:MAG: aspartyl protease family protein [Methanophagales archaeon]|nr:aspartyl protease family protein [Methanophagales archaeon]